MKNPLLILPLLILGIINLGSVGASAESLVSAEIRVEEGDFTVGDPLPLVLVVNHPPGYEVILPQMEPDWGDFLVNSQSSGTTVTNPDGSETTSQMIDARLFSPGTFKTPPLNLTVSDRTGQLTEITAQPVSVTIASVLVEGDTNLRDIKPQADLPYINYLAWLIGLGILASGIAATYFLIRRRRNQLALAAVDNRLPHEIALDELDRIESLDLPHTGRFKEHYTFVSECIRVYMENTYHFPVLERTTGEIRSNLKRTTVKKDAADQFIELLVASDLVKFSKFTPDITSAHQVLIRGRGIIERTRPVVIETEGEKQVQISPTPPEPKFGENDSKNKAEVTL
ncbi:MAG: hypothetical protein AB8I56_09285 [Anaerolineales bacterium]